MEINANGIENSNLGQAIRDLYDLRNGEIVNNGYKLSSGKQEDGVAVWYTIVK